MQRLRLIATALTLSQFKHRPRVCRVAGAGFARSGHLRLRELSTLRPTRVAPPGTSMSSHSNPIML